MKNNEIKIALAAAIGANCLPCFDNLYERARLSGITDEEIGQIVDTANKVKTGASLFLTAAVNEALGRQPDSQEPCCTTPAGRCC